MKNSPSALIIPISINTSWRMLKYGKFPNGIGNRITFDVHEPIPVEGNLDELIAKTEAIIISGITSF